MRSMNPLSRHPTSGHLPSFQGRIVKVIAVKNILPSFEGRITGGFKKHSSNRN